MTNGSWRQKAMNEVGKLAELPKDWHVSGMSQCIQLKAREGANRILRLAPLYSAEVWVVPQVDGGINLEWDVKALDRTLEIEVTPIGGYVVFACQGDDVAEESEWGPESYEPAPWIVWVNGDNG